MKLKIKKALSFLVIFTIIISGFNLGLPKLASVSTQEVEASSLVDGTTGATINIQRAIENVKNKVTEAEEIYNNAVKEQNKNKYKKESLERFNNEIKNAKAKLENTSNTSKDLAQIYNKLLDEILIFKSSIIIEEDKTKNNNSTNPVDEEKSKNSSTSDNKKEVKINAAIVGMYNEIILEPKSINLKGNTAEDVLKLNGIKYELNEDGTIKSINDIVNGTKTQDELATEDGFYGKGGKWICLINSKEIKGSIKTLSLKSGDYIMFYYSRDGKTPCYDINKNDFININVKMFNVEAKKIVDQKLLILKGSNEYFIAKNVFNKIGITNIKCSTETGYIRVDGHEARVIINEDAKTVRNIFTDIKENDNVVIYETGYEDISEAPYFSKVQVSSNKVNRGESIEVSVLKVDEDFDADEEGVYTYAPAGKVRVYFGDKVYETDEEGKVNIICTDVGEFQVYADYDEMFINEDDYYENFILPSNKIKVVVKGEEDTSNNKITEEINKEELIKLINDAKILYKNAEEGEIEGTYKKESKNKLSDEITIAMNVVSDKKVTEEQLNEEIKRFKLAIEEFKKSVVKINVEELNNLLEEALKINNSSEIGSDQGQYRECDKEKFENEIKNAQNLLGNKNKIQKYVDDEVLKLKNAIEEFKNAAIDIRKNFIVKAINLPKEFKKGESKEITFEATNNTEENKQVCVIIGIFNKNNKLIKYSAIKKVVNSGDSVSLTSYTKLPSEEGCKVKTFVWDSLEGMKLISNAIETPIK